MKIESRLRDLYQSGELDIPFPGSGRTSLRHRTLAKWAREDLSLARLAEAHVDALAIIAEAGMPSLPGLYGVWAAEKPERSLQLSKCSCALRLTGTKMFCSGADLVDRALITVEGCLVDVDLRQNSDRTSFDATSWKTSAFSETNTATVNFSDTPVTRIIGERNWYLDRPGFWHGACGPAACWAGGAAGLADYATSHSREDPHTMAHLGVMRSAVWAMEAYLDRSASEIDADPFNTTNTAKSRALIVRHLIEESCSEILTRLGRAFGPRPLAFDASISQRYQEVQLYIRQSHAEHDLESLARSLLTIC